ncbi:hypothetical protein QOZ80_6BG0500530 [Eleusine coracana subsp. coracana]|nr:hypothetical protein QOZ80_6BG0500530 [Eleusine coracana subsp. coracana]
MESGEPRSSASGGASPPPPDPPPTGWLAGLVSGAGRILASVLGPDSSGCSSCSTASAAASDGDSPSVSCSPASSGLLGEGHNDGADHGDSSLFPLKNNQLNQYEGETVVKDYVGSLAIVSEIGPKDAITQLLMQETYSRSECTRFIKIIQERVLDSDSGTIPKLTHTDQSPLTNNAGNIQPVLKRSCSMREDAYEEVRRVRPKINENLLNISKFKQVDIIRNHQELKTKNPDTSRDENTLPADFPGAINLTLPNIISKVQSADEVLDVPNKPSVATQQAFGSSSSQACEDQIKYGTTILNRCSSQLLDLKKGFPLKVEPLNVGTPFEQQMMDLSHQKQENDVSNDSCSLSKLMLKEDIESASSLPGVIQLQNGSKSRRRRQPNSQKTTPTPTRSPAKGPRRKNNDIAVKTEMDLLDQSKMVLMEQEPPELGDIPVKRPVGRPRKVR